MARHTCDVSHSQNRIDLPLKIPVWEDSHGKVWVSYNSPPYLQERHGVPQESTAEGETWAAKAPAEAQQKEHHEEDWCWRRRCESAESRFGCDCSSPGVAFATHTNSVP